MMPPPAPFSQSLAFLATAMRQAGVSGNIANTASTPIVLGHLIGGRATTAAMPTKRSLPINNNKEHQGQQLMLSIPHSPDSAAAVVDSAVRAAKARLCLENGLWQRESAWRKTALQRIATRLAEPCSESSLNSLLAAAEVYCSGKTIRDAEVDIAAAADCFGYFAAQASRMDADHSSDAKEVAGHVYSAIRRPLGICGLITSDNYPILLAAWKMAPALAFGNAVIIKPAENSSLSSLLLGEMMAHELRSLLPSSSTSPESPMNTSPSYAREITPENKDWGCLINVVLGQGRDSTGQFLASHPDVTMISFTGSPEGGAAVAQQCAHPNHTKRLVLELGGKNCMIVCEDADLEKAADDIVQASFANAGQNCCAGSVLFAHGSIHEALLQLIKKKAEALVVGDPWDRKTDMGPLSNEIRLNRVLKHIQSAKREGCKLLCGGQRIGSIGYFVEPTVFYDVPLDAKIANEEIFGPVLAVMPSFENIDVVIEHINFMPYSLAAGVWTRNEHQGRIVFEKLNVGTTWLNCYNLVHPAFPFGGRSSTRTGYGTDLGIQAIDNYTWMRTLVRKSQ